MEITKENERTESVYARTLYAVLFCGAATRQALLVLSKNPLTTYRAIERAIECKHLKEYKTTIKVLYKKRRISYFEITKAGIRYLADRVDSFPEDMAWVDVIPCEAINTNIFANDRSGTKIYRHLRIATANIFFSAMGAEVWPIIAEPEREPELDTDEFSEAVLELLDECDDDDEKYIGLDIGLPDIKGKAAEPRPNSLGGAIRNTFELAEAHEQNFNGAIKNPGAKLKFSNAKRITQLMQTMTNGERQAFYYGREAGIVESPLKTVIVYTGSKAGMAWNKFHMSNEQRIYGWFQWVSAYRNKSTGTLPGMLIVDNPKMLADLYFDTQRKRRSEKFGDGLESLLIVPNTREGVENAKQYLTTDVKAGEQEVIDEALRSGNFEKRRGRYDGLFPLNTTNGKMTSVGVFIDGVKIKSMQKAVQDMEAPFAIICAPWQREYYRRILPGAELITIRME